MHDRRQPSEPLRIGPFELDLRARELRKNGRRIPLQDKPFELLAALVERSGEIVTREELRRRLWPADTFVVFDDSLNTAVNKAREALGDSADAPAFIQTVPRHGYRYIGPVDEGSPPRLSVIDTLDEPHQTPRRQISLVVLVSIGAITVAAISAYALRGRDNGDARVVRFQIPTPSSTRFPRWPNGVALSPDGQQIVFSAVSDSEQTARLWIGSLNSAEPRVLSGTEGAQHPCWSSDGQSIAFTASDRLKRRDIRGLTIDLGEAKPIGCAWSGNLILFGRGKGHGLYRVSADGGIPEAATTLDASIGETVHGSPQWLPDGRSFIYRALATAPERSGIYLARAGETTRQLVLAGDHGAVYAEPGFLLYNQESRLLAQPFDPKKGRLHGVALEIASEVAVESDGAVAFAASTAGVLAYTRRGRLPSRELVWVDRVGRRLGAPIAADHYADFSLSPDGRVIALQRLAPDLDPPAPDLWTLDLTRGVRSRVTDNPGNDEGAVWAPDSRRFAYARHDGPRKPADLYLKDLSEPDKDQPLLVDDAGSKHPFDFSPDGRRLLYGRFPTKDSRQDIWVLALDRDGHAFPWLATKFNEAEARFSPDGRWIAYESDETGRTEIFVRSFDKPLGIRIQMSANGGTRPQWRRDGREMYYVGADYQLMAVSVRIGATLEADAPRSLFELRRLEPLPKWPTPYAAAADGQRFLIGAVTDEGSGSPIGIVLNWTRLIDR